MVERATVGNATIEVVLDVAPPPFEPSRFFPDVPLDRWEPYKREHLDAEGKFRTNFCGWLVRTRDRVVLVDTGLGPGPHQPFGGAGGQFLSGLQAKGVRPSDVSAVVITHLHGDHMGWNVTQRQGKATATFPNSRYVLPRGDWDYFTKPEVLESQAAVKANAVPLQSLGVLELAGDDHSVTPEIRTVSAPGHTPGHLCVLVSSQGQHAMIIGDLIHSSVQVTEADWCGGADMDKEVARRSRHAILDRLQREGFVVGAGHLPVGRSIGRVVMLRGKRHWQVL